MFNDRYIAKESLTFPLLVTVMFVMCLYEAINTSETWFIIDTVFFGLIVTVYAYKYIRHGRTSLIIDSKAIIIDYEASRNISCRGYRTPTSQISDLITLKSRLIR